MSEWRKRFKANARYEELKDIGPFKICGEPEKGDKGTVICTLTTPHGQLYRLQTYEATVGDIFVQQGEKDDWVVASNREDPKKKKEDGSAKVYVKFSKVKKQ